MTQGTSQREQDEEQGTKGVMKLAGSKWLPGPSEKKDEFWVLLAADVNLRTEGPGTCV